VAEKLAKKSLDIRCILSQPVSHTLYFADNCLVTYDQDRQTIGVLRKFKKINNGG